MAHDYAHGLGGDTGDPLWTPPTYHARWPETIPEKQRHLINPDLLTIKQARDTYRNARDARFVRSEDWVRARNAWRLAHVRARHTSLAWETRYLCIHARAFLDIVSDQARP